VKLSVKSDYAARAVLALARHYPDGGARRVEELAAQDGIPPNYLVQILIELKANRIVKSVRGKEGGYLLARPPGEITMGDVLRAIHGQLLDAPALSDAQCSPELRAAWKKLQKAFEHTADSISFQQLLDESRSKEKMYYI
jgi:Rrf2 family protein